MAGWREQVTWAGIAIGCYLLASLVFLIVAFGTGLFGLDGSPVQLTVADAGGLVASVLLFVVGGYAMWRVRRTGSPDGPEIPSQFRSGPSRPGAGSKSDGSADASTRCPNCGTENDRGYTFCHNCSEKLPE